MNDPKKDAAQPAAATVKIKLNYPTLVGEKIGLIGEVVTVSEADAARMCAEKFRGGYDFDGERSDKTATRTEITRATRVA